jgi:hypothetical protein
VSNRIPESRAALLSSLSAVALGKMLSSPAASIGVWSARPDGSVAAIVPNPTKMRRAQKGDWTVSIDEELIGEIATVRAQSLPRETGVL